MNISDHILFREIASYCRNKKLRYGQFLMNVFGSEVEGDDGVFVSKKEDGSPSIDIFYVTDEDFKIRCRQYMKDHA